MEKINAAILEICSGSANAEDTLDGVFGSIHRAIAGMIPAQNFYIALDDPPR